MKLKDCLENIIDNRGKNPKYYAKETYPVIDNIMIKNNYYPNIKEATRFIDQKTHDNFLRGYLEPDLPIMTLVGSGIGNVSLSVDNKSVIVQNTIGFKTKPELLDSIYLYYWFLYKHDELIQFNRGSGQPSIRKSDVENMNIDLKNINYQKKVSKILSTIDKKIMLNTETNNNLYEIGSILINRFFEFDNQQEKYKEIINFKKGKKPTAITNIYQNGYKKYLTIACLIGEENNYADPNKMLITDHDILMVMDGASSGETYFSSDGIVSSTLSKIEIINRNYIPEYIFFTLKKYKKDIQSQTTGSAIPHTNKDIVFNLSVPKIKIKEQLIFTTLLDIILQKNEENIKLSQLRDTLLPKLMNGEIDLDNIKI